MNTINRQRFRENVRRPPADLPPTSRRPPTTFDSHRPSTDLYRRDHAVRTPQATVADEQPASALRATSVRHVQRPLSTLRDLHPLCSSKPHPRPQTSRAGVGFLPGHASFAYFFLRGSTGPMAVGRSTDGATAAMTGVGSDMSSMSGARFGTRRPSFAATLNAAERCEACGAGWCASAEAGMSL